MAGPSGIPANISFFHFHGKTSPGAASLLTDDEVHIPQVLQRHFFLFIKGMHPVHHQHDLCISQWLRGQLVAADFALHDSNVQLAVHQVPLYHVRIVYGSHDLHPGIRLVVSHADVTQNGGAGGNAGSHPHNLDAAVLLHALVHLLHQIQYSAGIFVQPLAVRQQDQRFVPPLKELDVIVLLDLRNGLADSRLGDE